MCYNNLMRKRQKIVFFLLLICLIWMGTLSNAYEPEDEIDNLILQLQDAFNSKNIESYIGYFNANIRDLESNKIISMIEDFQIERVTIHKVLSKLISENQIDLHLRVNYDNDFSVIIEHWRLKLIKIDGNWLVNFKEEVGDIQTLYKISIPSGRMERAKSVEINHIDIQLVFQDVAVFYDNLPNRDTALLIVGKGTLKFSPSLERERHQLDLIYGNSVLTDDLKYVYIRCSHSFFKDNISITQPDNDAAPITQS